MRYYLYIWILIGVIFDVIVKVGLRDWNEFVVVIFGRVIRRVELSFKVFELIICCVIVCYV